MDFSALTDPSTGILRLENFELIIESVLPIIGVAVMLGFLFYAVRWAIGLFRGI